MPFTLADRGSGTTIKIGKVLFGNLALIIIQSFWWKQTPPVPSNCLEKQVLIHSESIRKP